MGFPRMILAAATVASILIAAACGGGDASGEQAAPAAASEPLASQSSTAGASLPVSEYAGSYTIADDEFGTMVSVDVAGATRTIESNSLPNHETGEFPNDGNPNTISEQSLSYEFPAEPVFTGSASRAQTPGVAINGVAFEPGTAETVTCDSGETYRIEALQGVFDLGLDLNNAHVQPGGQYHYHGLSELLVEALDAGNDLVHVGFAADGFLVYYSLSASYTSSYELGSDARTGTGCVASGPTSPTVEVDGTTPDGTYTSDWLYVEGAGDLDSCNGTTIDGQYVYLLTLEYPYIPRCLNGEFTETMPGGMGQGPVPEGLAAAAEALGVSVEELEAALGVPPDPSAAAETLGISRAELEAALPPPAAAPGESP